MGAADCRGCDVKLPALLMGKPTAESKVNMVEFLRLNRHAPSAWLAEGGGRRSVRGVCRRLTGLPGRSRRVIALMRPTDSWTGKWLRLEKFVPGSYAIQCSSDLPSEVEGLLEDLNINWHRRD